jgi:hypothetical protein
MCNPGLGEETSPTLNCLFLALSFHVDFFYHFALGTMEPLGQASKLFFFAPLRSLMDDFMSSCYVAGMPFIAGLPHLTLMVASTSPACLYFEDLSL